MKRPFNTPALFWVMIYTRDCRHALALESDNPIFTNHGPWNLECLDMSTFRSKDDVTDQLIQSQGHSVSERKARLARSRRVSA